MQQCPLNESRSSAKQSIDTELLVLDNVSKFMKLRFNENSEENEFEVLMSLDLSVFPNIVSLVENMSPDDTTILTSRSITH